MVLSSLSGDDISCIVGSSWIKTVVIQRSMLQKAMKRLTLRSMVRVKERVFVLNAFINNISVVSWWPVLFVEETGVRGKKPPTCRKSLTNLST